MTNDQLIMIATVLVYTIAQIILICLGKTKTAQKLEKEKQKTLNKKIKKHKKTEQKFIEEEKKIKELEKEIISNENT